MKSIILNISFGFLISILGLNNIFAQQNIGISETQITPDITSILEVYSTSKGILIPRLTTAQRNAIVSPANGLLVFDTEEDCFMFYSSFSSAWQSLCNSAPTANSYLISSNTLSSGTLCPNGGIQFSFGFDLNNNNSLDVSEIDPAMNAFVCNGLQGSIGLTGATGLQGDQGIQGLTGATGIDGATGPQGIQGLTGATGPQGDQGIQGLTGATGPQGDQGDQGLTGATGPQGDQGIQGLTGATGPQGIQGLTGATGPQGDQGIQGLTGAIGPIGLTGATGPQGIQGLTGATGLQGDQGIQGLTGATGQQGDQGIQGLTGATGLQGDQGIQGLTGATGPQGDQGIQGLTGATGLQGDQGIQGLPGTNGTNGAVGATGPIGPTGLTGPAGATGPQGPAGPNNVKKYSVVGTTNATIPANAAAGPFTSMPEMTITFTPINSSVFMFFTAAGTYTAAPFNNHTVWFEVRVNGVSIREWDTQCGTGWNLWDIGVSAPLNVNVGVSNTIEIRWAAQRAGATNTTINNLAASESYFNRSLMILDAP